MPKLFRSSKIGANIELDSGETIILSVAQEWVIVRLLDRKGGLLGELVSLSAFFGRAVLYNERSASPIAHVLSVRYPNPALRFENTVLMAFANAVWHCSSAVEVARVINEAAQTVENPESPN